MDARRRTVAITVGLRIHVCAVGRLRGTPEAALVNDYLGRFARVGRSIGLTLGDVHEVEDRLRSSPTQQAALLRKSIPAKAILWAMDERGQTLSSSDFAKTLAHERDQGTANVAIAIGGADGLDPAFRAEAHLVLSFGPMVWPHMLARAMLSEQLYRAATILAGGPYHRA